MARKSIYDRFQSGYVPGRDASDYARRMYRGYVRGLSPSQARGHARQQKGELPVSAMTRKDAEELVRSAFTNLVFDREENYDQSNHRIYNFQWDNLPDLPELIRENKDNATRAFVRVTRPDGKVLQTQTYSLKSSTAGGSLGGAVGGLLDAYGDDDDNFLEWEFEISFVESTI